MTRTSRDAFAFLAGVFLLCMSVLMIQIIQTRILSVVSLYYMAFFSISMAMLGLTGGALIVYYKLDHVNSGERQRLPVEDIDGFRVVHRRLLHHRARVSPAKPGLGDLRRALAKGHCAARGAVHGRWHCSVARPDTQRLPDRHHLWRRPARRRDRLPRLAGPADVDGRLVGHVHDSGPGRGCRLVLWPCRLRAGSSHPHPELAHFWKARFRRRLSGGACRIKCLNRCRPAAHRGQVRPARPAQQHLPHQMEFVFAHRCVAPDGRPAVSLGRLAGNAAQRYGRAPRTDHRRDGRDMDASVLRRARWSRFPALRRHQSRLLRPPQWAFRRHRGRQRTRYPVGPPVRVPRHHRRRAQSDLHRPPHGPGKAAGLCRHRRPSGRAPGGRRRPELVRADPGEIRPDRDEHGRHLGGHRRRRFLALRERALYGRGLEDLPLGAHADRPVHGIPLALAALHGRARSCRQPGRRHLDGTRRRTPERPHLHRRGRQSRHRHRVARAVRPVRPAGTAGHHRQVALHRAREPGPARYGHGHRRHAHGAGPAGPEQTGRAPLPRRVPAHRRPAILLQPASVYPSERHPLRVTAMAGWRDF